MAAMLPMAAIKMMYPKKILVCNLIVDMFPYLSVTRKQD